uniref:Uncharacterized protein n=1 Tax=Chlamydomonas euryale TaxID=1486919 RepID=A0A7R9VJN6_9CHLO|mmetsp:Transcript_36864/g.108710  ORF Transcript_36864/g.108710 Transcript_36864/m.108710 type:complete len:167 (+) Transcript_36864:287-787(+)
MCLCGCRRRLGSTFFDARGLSAVDQFAAWSTLLKAGQALAVGMWLWASRPAGLCFDIGAVTLPGWLGTLLLVTLGLALSAGVVSALGKDGVFYGSRIGEHPHVHASAAPPEEWPFSVVQHPQHIGPVLVVWAPLVALLPQLPATAWFVASYWSTLYFINWVVEDFF